MADEIKTISGIDANATIKLEWGKGNIGVPNAISRSGLFSAGRRREIDDITQIATSGNFSVSCFGSSTLSIPDFVVFIALMHICWTQDTGTQERRKRTVIDCSLGDIVHAMGRKRTTSEAAHVFQSLRRLSQTLIEINSKELGYFSGSLISLGSDKTPEKISTGHRVVVAVNPKLQDLYQAGRWKALNFQVIRQLGRDNLALWLYCFLSSHTYSMVCQGRAKNALNEKMTIYYGSKKLLELSGSKNSPSMYNTRLSKSLKKIQLTTINEPTSDVVFCYDLSKSQSASKNNESGTYKVTARFVPKSTYFEQISIPVEEQEVEVKGL